jgi:hypothetical protein
MSQEVLLQNLRETRAQLAGQLEQARAEQAVEGTKINPEQAETMVLQFESTIIDLDKAIALFESIQRVPLNP